MSALKNALTEIYETDRDVYFRITQDDALELFIQTISTDALKKLVAERVAAEAAVAYNHYHEGQIAHTQGEDDMSRKPQDQRRNEIRDAEKSKAIWASKRDQAKNATERATYQRAVDRNQKIIDRNKT